jgi:hypothetical protein
MQKDYRIKISLIPIFYDKNHHQTNAEYIKLLISNNSIISKELTLFHKDIKNCVEELFTDYIKINYEWPSKELVSCRKLNDTIEIIYTTSMPFINGSVKNGELINISDFVNTIEDKYYVEAVNGSARKF